MIESSATDEGRAVGRWVRWLRIGSLAPLVVALLIYGIHGPFRDFMNQGVSLLVVYDVDGLERWADDAGGWAAFATLLLMIVQAVAAPIPAFLVTATNALLFGPFWGALWSILTATLAAMVCYLMARFLGDTVVGRFVPKQHLVRSDRFFREHGAAAVLAARLLPFIPFDPISYTAGLVRMRPWSFFWATLVGQIPAGFAYSYLAREILAKRHHPMQLVVTAISTVLALALVGWIARRVLFSRRRGDAEAS